MILLSALNLLGCWEIWASSWVKHIGDVNVSLNEQMIEEGYAWAYDGGTKKKDFEELREIRRSFGTLDAD